MVQGLMRCKVKLLHKMFTSMALVLVFRSVDCPEQTYVPVSEH